MSAHRRLRSHSDSSSSAVGSDSGSEPDSHNATDSDGQEAEPSSEADSEVDTPLHPARQPQRDKHNQLVLFAILGVLLLLAVGAGAWYFLAGPGASTATASSAASTATGTLSGSMEGTGAETQVVEDTPSNASGTVLGGTSQKSATTGSTTRLRTSSSAESASVTDGPSPLGDGGAGNEVDSRTASSSVPITAVAAATASPSPTPTSSSPLTASATASSCKKGVGYNDAIYTTQLDVCWVYDWSSSGGTGIRAGAVYIPMLWGPQQVDGWSDTAQKAIAAGATHVLGFNEPDLPEQANLSPAYAAQLWKEYIEPLAGSAKLVSPSVTNGVALDNGTAMGVPWLSEFLAACDGCTIDAVGLHWYDTAGNTAYFTSYLEDAYATLNKSVWLTEFMGTGTPSEQQTFLEFAVPWLEEQEWIGRYAAYGDFLNNSVAEFIASEDGSLNDLGTTYSDAQ